MEDLYKDDPNFWLRRVHFSKTVYHRPDPSQKSIISIAELKLASSKTNTSQAITGTMPTMKLNPDSSFSGEEPVDSDSEANKTEPVSENSATSDMLKNNDERTVRRLFVAAHLKQGVGAKTVKSSRPKKGIHWLQKYLDCGVCRVCALEIFSEVR